MIMKLHLWKPTVVTVLCGMWILLGHFAQSAGTPFLTCENATQKCASLGRCTELPIYTEEYSSKNVLCINRNTGNDVVRPPYRLHGCPTEFFNTYQSTSGVCSVRTDNGTDLILAVNEMAPGLHSFSCIVPEAPNEIVSNYAVIVNDTVYRDFRIIINGLLQYYHNSTNITLDVGSNLTVVVLAVGNVSVINASDPRFICETDFACSHNPDGLPNRYLKCSLRTPSELSDNGRSLLVSIHFIDNIEMMRFSITVNKSSTITNEGDDEGDDEGDEGGDNEGNNRTSSDDPSLLIGASVVIAILVILVFVLVAIFLCYRCKKRCSQEAMMNVEEGHHIAKEVFRQCYEQLVSILPIIIADILPKLISERIISIDDREEINNKPRSKDKASFILDNIGRSLEAGAKENFYALLDIMEECGNDDVRDIVIKMRRMLMTVLSFHCRNCNQMWNEIKSHGYTIKRIPTKAGNILRTSLDQGIPLMMCNCSECEIPREVAQVLNSPILCSWNALQLHQADSGNALPSNGVVQVTAMSEVLAWLETKLPRRISTVSSVASQQRGSHYSLGWSGE